VLVIIGTLASTIGAALPVIGAIGAALLAVASGPIGAVVLAVGALVAVWHFFGDEITSVLSDTWSFIKDTFTSIMGLFDIFPDWLLPLLGPIGAIVLAFRHWDAIVEIAKNVYTGVKTWLVDKLQPILDWVSGVWSTIFGEKAKVLQADIHLTDDAAAADDRAAASARGLGEGATFSVRGIRAQADANKDAEKAAEAATKAVDAQTDAFRALGLITQQDVTTEIQKLQGALTAAAREGAGPTQRAVTLVIAKLVELRIKALAAGQSVEEIDRVLGSLRVTARDMAGPFPTLSAQISRTIPVAANLATGIRTITAEQVKAGTEAHLLGRAYETLGVTTQKSLSDTVAAARIAYADIAASGRATERELKEARAAVEQAEIDAGLRTVSLWQTQIQPAIEGAWQNITGSLATNFTDMLTGATSFKDGFLNIWEDLKSSVRGILDTLLQTFLNEFLGGTMEGLNGWARQAGSIIGSIFKMGGGAAGGGMNPFGGSVIPQLAGPGGAGAGAGGAGVGAGLATAGHGALAVGAAVAQGAFALEFGRSFFGPHHMDPEAFEALQQEAHQNQTDYSGGAGFAPWDDYSGGVSVHSLRGGGWGRFGGGAPAVLHDTEAVFPLPDGFDLASSLKALQRVEHRSAEAGSGATDLVERLGRRFDRALVDLRTLLPLQLRDALGAR
jgi:hypothetical protein